MTVDEAAHILGVTVGATGEQVQAAYRVKARTAHPDQNGSTAEFIRVATARDVLLARVSTAREPVVVARIAPKPSPLLILTWVGLILVSAFLATVRSELPFTLAEPLARYAVLVGALVAYALTGRRPYFVVAVVAVAVTAVLAIAYATIGALVGLLILIAPFYGLTLIGLRARR